MVFGEGNYFLAYTRFSGSARDDSAASIFALTSQDFGETWSEPFELQPRTHVNAMAPSLVRLDSGQLGLGYIEKTAKNKARIMYRSSDDNGETWAEAVCVRDIGRYTICLNSVLLQHSSGRLLYPYFECDAPWAGDEHLVGGMAYSDDNGKTWAFSTTVLDCPGRGLMEPVVFERQDGNLEMYIRTDTGRVWKSVSRDRGVTWTETEATQIVSTQSPLMVVRLPSNGMLALCWNHNYIPGAPHGGPRNPLNLAFSRNDGETWESEVVLENDPASTFAYPTIQVDGPWLLLTYYRTKFQMALGDTPDLRISLWFRRIRLNHLLPASMMLDHAST